MSLMQPPPPTHDPHVSGVGPVLSKWMRCEALTAPEAVMVADLSLRNRIEQLSSVPTGQRARFAGSF